ncbi:MAG: protein TolQ [Nitrospinae bacterium]|nr:protein TolQ [Nitrospinota bacterium]
MTQSDVTTYTMSVLEMVAHSGVMAKMVLVLLLLFSIISWAIIFNKFFVYRNAKKEDGAFLSIFSKSESLTNIYNYSRDLKYSPVARVFLTGYHELYLFQELAKTERERAGTPDSENGVITEADLKGISLALNKAINREIDRLASRLEFLATTGSITPFIGLFGTVWGIMHSFRVIGVKGSASIGGVAPGIAEALIATAAGLLAAIPAVIFYNYLSNKIRLFSTKMDDFSHDFIYMAEKNFMR